MAPQRQRFKAESISASSGILTRAASLTNTVAPQRQRFHVDRISTSSGIYTRTASLANTGSSETNSGMTFLFLCPRHAMAEGHIEFTLSMFVYSRIVSGP